MEAGRKEGYRGKHGQCPSRDFSGSSSGEVEFPHLCVSNYLYTDEVLE